MFPVADFAIIAICIAGLYFGAKWIVAAAVGLARKLGVSDIVIGLTIVAIGTSTPELAVTISSVIRQEIDLAIGNVVGSNIINLGFILGGVAIISTVPVTRRLVLRDGGMLIGATLLLVLFFLDHTFTWWEGAVFLLVLLVYIASLIASQDMIRSIPTMRDFNWQDVPWFLLGSILVVVCSDLFIASALNIANYFDSTSWVIGVTLVALGTSLPEIMASGIAALNGRPEISVGNLIGSNLFNLLGVMGLAGLLSPNGNMHLGQFLVESSWMLLILMLTVVWMMFTGWEVSKREGIALFIIATLCWVINFSDLTLIELF
ncbi:MAG: cation:H+ antiporter [Cellvibrionaceae bacterium]|jgi:cation:H+ antiporter